MDSDSAGDLLVRPVSWANNRLMIHVGPNGTAMRPAMTTPPHELFARQGIRCTRQRLAVYEALRATRCHPTAEELHRQVRSQVGGLSLATVYNTLEVLVRAGLCRRLPTTDGCCRFDADTSEHLHLRDRVSGQILDGPHDLGDALVRRLPSAVLREIEQRYGVRICGVSVQLQVERHPVATGRNGRAQG